MTLPGNVRLTRHIVDLDDDGHEDILTSVTTETDTSLVLAPDGTGGVEWGPGGGTAGSEPVEVVAISGAAVTLDFDTARWWDITLTANCTFTITNPPDPVTVGELVVVLRQGGSGSYTVTWPASVDWQDTDGTGGGSAPTLWTVVGAENVITLVTFDGGTTWGGSTGGSSSPTGPAGGDLSGTYPNPSVVDDSHNHTAATLPAASAASDHEHVDNIVFSGDGSTTVWELPAAPVSDTGIEVYVGGSRSIAWVLSGTLLTTLTFDSAPASSANNIVIDIVAATA